jgi:hypothetical protein
MIIPQENAQGGFVKKEERAPLSSLDPSQTTCQLNQAESPKSKLRQNQVAIVIFQRGTIRAE